jgi:hypothetical protein
MFITPAFFTIPSHLMNVARSSQVPANGLTNAVIHRHEQTKTPSCFRLFAELFPTTAAHSRQTKKPPKRGLPRLATGYSPKPSKYSLMAFMSCANGPTDGSKSFNASTLALVSELARPVSNKCNS